MFWLEDFLEHSQEKMSKVYTHEGFLYATNGHIAIRVKQELIKRQYVPAEPFKGLLNTFKPIKGELFTIQTLKSALDSVLPDIDVCEECGFNRPVQTKVPLELRFFNRFYLSLIYEAMREFGGEWEAFIGEEVNPNINLSENAPSYFYCLDADISIVLMPMRN